MKKTNEYELPALLGRLGRQMTAPMRADDALRRLVKVLDTMQIGVTVTDTDGRIVYTNPAEAKMHGYSVDELIGRDVGIFAPPKARRPLILEELRTLMSWSRECLNVRKDGSVFPVRLLSDVVSSADGEPICVVATCEDIGERQRMEEALREARDELDQRVLERTAELSAANAGLERERESRERGEAALRQSEEQYRTLVEAVPHGIEEIDASGIMVVANAAHHKQYEYGEGELIGMSVFDLAATDSEREELREYLKYLVNEQPPPTSYFGRKKTKQGRVIDVQVAWDYKRDDQGRVTGFTSVITDITERKKVEEEQARINAELERFNRLAVGREERMIELKRQVNELLEQVGQPPAYDLSFVGEDREESAG